jgi:hypothetical protein
VRAQASDREVELSEQSGSWQPDPFGRHQYRYWDGTQWTESVSNDGVVTNDPPTADPGGAGSDERAEGGAPDETSGREPGGDEPFGAPTEPTPAAHDDPTVPAASAPGWGPPSGDTTTTMSATPPPGGGDPGGPPPEEPSGGGSNLPGIIIGVVLLLLLIGALVWFFVLSGDDDADDDARETVVASLRADRDLTSSEANCVADELDDAGYLEDIAEAIEAGNDPSPRQENAILDAFEECGVDGPPDDTTTTTEDDTTTTTEAASSNGFMFPPAMMAIMAQEFADEMGVTVDEAECFLEGLFSSMSDDQMQRMLTDPDSFDDFESMSMALEVMEDCGINPRDLDPDFGGGASSGAETYGDDPALDALWDACEEGDDEACDDLYMRSPFGSEYEEFGDTCAGRGRDGIWCAD